MKIATRSLFGISVTVLVAAVAVQGFALRRSAAVPHEPPPRLKVGDTLANARFVAGATLSSIRTRAGLANISLEELTSHRCVVLAFFESHCSGCRQLAPAWSGLDTLPVAGGRIPIYWITAHRTDSGAAEFVQLNRLPARWMAIASRRDQYDLGVTSWPLHYLVGSNRRFLGYLSAIPNPQLKLPLECRS